MGVTIKQIAKEVGLSWPTVSQILNNRGSFAEETKRKVLAAAASHDYRPSSTALALRKKGSARLIGVLFRNDVNNPLTNMAGFEYLMGINQQLQEADFGTLVIRASDIAREDGLEPRVFRERMVDGVIVVGALPDSLVDRVQALAARLIWLDAPIWKETCCVRRDEFAAGASCIKALAELDYKRANFVARDSRRLMKNAHYSHQMRLAGVEAGASEYGMHLRTLYWPEEDNQAEYDASCDVMNHPEVGVVAGSLPVARRILHHTSAFGKNPGIDYGMVCCDDSYDTRIYWPSLSRVAFDRYQLGQQAADMMLKLVNSPETPPPSVMQAYDWKPGSSAWGPDV